MDIDRNAPATASSEIQVAASPETVWDVLSDLPNWPEWNADVRSMSLQGPLRPGTEFRWKSGAASLRSELQSVERPTEIGWTGTTMGIHAVHVFRFQPKDGGTLARSEESFSGLIPSVLKSYSRRTLKRGIESFLAALKTEAERRAS